MTELNRHKQRAMLEKLAAVYPRKLMGADLSDEDNWPIADLWYLDEHGLIELNARTSNDGSQTIKAFNARMTAKGCDFLRGDGGLSAILGVVTIKIHDDTIKSMIEAKILNADLPPAEKRKWIDALRTLPAETTKHLAMKLVDLGLDQLPAALPLLQKLLAGA